VIVFSDDYDSLQSQSDAVKTESQTLLAAAAAAAAVAAESLEPSTSNPSDAAHVVDRKPAKSADDDVLNLVKVKQPEDSAEMEAGNMAKEDEGDEKHDVKASMEQLICESSDVKKEDGKDDEDTLSESETAGAGEVKQSATPADSVDTGKDEAAVKLTHKDDADEDMDHSAIPSPCPEVR